MALLNEQRFRLRRTGQAIQALSRFMFGAEADRPVDAGAPCSRHSLPLLPLPPPRRHMQLLRTPPARGSGPGAQSRLPATPLPDPHCWRTLAGLPPDLQLALNGNRLGGTRRLSGE